MNNLKQDKRGFTAILMVVLILFAIMTAAFGASALVLNNLNMVRVQTNSTKAFFAAEAAAERVLYDVRKRDFDIAGCVNGIRDVLVEPISCDGAPGNESLPLGNNARYSISSTFSDPLITIINKGRFGHVQRIVELKFNN
jgi:hypothetical protein